MTSSSTPPDGGYGWVVVLASFVAQMTILGFTWTVGVFYVIFLDVIDASTPATALIASLNMATFYLAGPLAGVLASRYGVRVVVVIGGFIGSLGLVLSSLAYNVYHLYCTFGLLSGCGLGLAFIPSISIVRLYFDKRGAMAMGLAVSGGGIGSFLFPITIRLLVDSYGWRGAILILAGITLNVCVCGALMRPPRCSPPDPQQAENDTLKSSKQRKGFAQMRIFLDLFILKNVNYLLVVFSIALFCFGLSVVYIHLSAYAATIGFTETHGAWLFSIVGLLSFGGRIAFGLLAQHPELSVNATLLYLVTLLATGAVTHVIPHVTSLPVLMTVVGGFGCLSGAHAPLLPSVFINTLSPDLLASAYAYMLMSAAAGTLLGAPTAAWVYVLTGVYATSFYLGGSVMMVSGSLVLIPWWRTRSRPTITDKEGNEGDGLYYRTVKVEADAAELQTV